MISSEVRQQILEAWREGGYSHQDLADKFDVAKGSVHNIVRSYPPGGKSFQLLHRDKGGRLSDIETRLSRIEEELGL